MGKKMLTFILEAILENLQSCNWKVWICKQAKMMLEQRLITEYSWQDEMQDYQKQPFVINMNVQAVIPT